jgi:hypothetical protein
MGLGDPGYRLRPGRTGFDPYEQTLEQARFEGVALKTIFLGKRSRYASAMLLSGFIGYLIATGDWTSLLVILGIAVFVTAMALIARSDLKALRRRRRRF